MIALAVGTRVRLSPRGRVWHDKTDDPKCWFTKSRDPRGTVVRPGVTRGGMYVRVLVDDEKEPRTFAREYWEPA